MHGSSCRLYTASTEEGEKRGPRGARPRVRSRREPTASILAKKTMLRERRAEQERRAGRCIIPQMTSFATTLEVDEAKETIKTYPKLPLRGVFSTLGPCLSKSLKK